MNKYIVKHRDWSIWILMEKDLNRYIDKVDIINIIELKYPKNEITGSNLYWYEYTKWKVDVVIPTRDLKSTFSSFEWIISDTVNLRVIERIFNKENGWFAAACNYWANINKSNSEFIIFINDDVKLFKWDIELMLKEFEDSSVGLVWAKCSETEWWVNGSLMAIRREIFERIWWFDEDYFFMWEDNDICENITRRWWNIAISWALATHEWKDSVNTEWEIWKQNYFKWKKIFEDKWKDDNRIIATMIVWDENGRYLKDSIWYLKKSFVDKIIIVCDWSNFETMAELDELKDEKTKIYYHDKRLFWEKENILRERTTSYAISQNPHWIIPLDADEILDPELKLENVLWLLNENIWIDFRIAHYWWDKEKVRIDWAFWNQFNIRLFKYIPEYWYKFYDRNIHCWSAPVYCYENRIITDYILHHYWYVNKEDIKIKSERQKKYDSEMSKENPDFYKRYETEPELITFNKELFLKKCKT